MSFGSFPMTGRAGCRGAGLDTLEHDGNVTLRIENLLLAFGGVTALTDVSIDVRERQIMAVIGPNGACRRFQLIAALLWVG